MLDSKGKYKVNEHPFLVSSYCFKGRDYLVKMNTSNTKTLEMKITDKHTSEDWVCSYDDSYIENLTRKTGNFKQFSIFVAMLKSGLMRTSESVSLDLLTFNDLEALTSKRVMSHTLPKHPEITMANAAHDKRYLIVIYTVEFDRIHYPLAMEYCGPPDSQVLLTTIRRLEQEVSQLQNQLNKNERSGNEELVLHISNLETRAHEVDRENKRLKVEVIRLNEQLASKNQIPRKCVEAFQNSISKLEEQVKQQRSSLKQQLNQFRADKAKLSAQVEEYRNVEKRLLHQLQIIQQKSKIPVRQSRLDVHSKKSQQKNIDQQPCILTHLGIEVVDGFKRSKEDPRNPTVSRRLQRRRSSSSESRTKRESSPRCILKASSSSLETVCPRQGNRSRKSNRSPAPVESSPANMSSSSSCTLVNLKNNQRVEKMKIKSKDKRTDFKITELERRVNALQQLLERDLSISH